MNTCLDLWNMPIVNYVDFYDERYFGGAQNQLGHVIFYILCALHFVDIGLF